MNDKRDGIEFFLGAIFDTGDTLSRQAFEYAVAKINAQSQIFKQSKIVVTQIDLVDAHDSFFAYKLGNSSLFFFSHSFTYPSLLIHFQFVPN